MKLTGKNITRLSDHGGLSVGGWGSENGTPGYVRTSGALLFSASVNMSSAR